MFRNYLSFFWIHNHYFIIFNFKYFFIIIFFIDLKHFIIPNVLTFPLMTIGFIKSFDPNLNKAIFPNYINSLIGGLIGYTIIWLIIYFMKKLEKKMVWGLEMQN